MVVADFSLQGKVAIVTGGSRGIGRSIALGLAEAGADVAIAARKPGPLQEAVEAVQAMGRRAIGVETNVRRMEHLQNLVDRTKDELGRIDVLVNNAGTNPHFGPLHTIEEGQWDVVMNTNLKAPFFLSVLCREAMLEHGDGGTIVNVSSVGGMRASDVIASYSISKAAMNMLTQACAKIWGQDGIRVNGIAPGLIKTEFSRALWENEEILSANTQSAALHRMADPDEMAGAAVYLASPASSFTTGQTLIMDGGVAI